MTGPRWGYYAGGTCSLFTSHVDLCFYDEYLHNESKYDTAGKRHEASVKASANHLVRNGHHITPHKSGGSKFHDRLSPPWTIWQRWLWMGDLDCSLHRELKLSPDPKDYFNKNSRTVELIYRCLNQLLCPSLRSFDVSIHLCRPDWSCRTFRWDDQVDVTAYCSMLLQICVRGVFFNFPVVYSSLPLCGKGFKAYTYQTDMHANLLSKLGCKRILISPSRPSLDCGRNRSTHREEKQTQHRKLATASPSSFSFLFLKIHLRTHNMQGHRGEKAPNRRFSSLSSSTSRSCSLLSWKENWTINSTFPFAPFNHQSALV